MVHPLMMVLVLSVAVLTHDCPADLNGDGTVTTGDLLIFLGAFRCYL